MGIPAGIKTDLELLRALEVFLISRLSKPGGLGAGMRVDIVGEDVPSEG